MRAVTRYTKPRHLAAAPTISHQGVTADRHEDNTRMLMDISFLPRETTARSVPRHGLPDRRRASDRARFPGHGQHEDPGAGRHRPASYQVRIRVGARKGGRPRQNPHPPWWASRQVEAARGVTIPKPGKDNHGMHKSYRIISLLNCLGKVVEKVTAIMVSAHCKATGGFHPGQYGCRTIRPVVGAV